MQNSTARKEKQNKETINIPDIYQAESHLLCLQFKDPAKGLIEINLCTLGCLLTTYCMKGHIELSLRGQS